MFNREIESMPAEKMKELQLGRLKWSIRHAYDNVPLYKKKFDAAGFHPDQFKSFDDMKRIYTSQHTSSNYHKKPGEFSSGKHGVGGKVTNALSDSFIVESYILGEARRMEFINGNYNKHYNIK